MKQIILVLTIWDFKYTINIYLYYFYNSKILFLYSWSQIEVIAVYVGSVIDTIYSMFILIFCHSLVF